MTRKITTASIICIAFSVLLPLSSEARECSDHHTDGAETFQETPHASPDSMRGVAAIRARIQQSRQNNGVKPSRTIRDIQGRTNTTTVVPQQQTSSETPSQKKTIDVITLNVIYTDDTTSTEMPKTGVIKFMLYPDKNLEPVRKNFVNLMGMKAYEGILFHRVINNFMIQTGDPASKDALPGTPLGGGNVQAPGVTAMPFVAGQLFESTPRYHKYGAVAVARTGDAYNPQREGSTSQFYIVTDSTKYTVEQLIGLGNRRRSNFIRVLQQNTPSVMGLGEAAAEAMYNRFYPGEELKEEVITAYATHGGAAYLDEDYTVIGEVLEGMDTVNAIQQLKVDGSDRPLGFARIVNATIMEVPVEEIPGAAEKTPEAVKPIPKTE